MSKPNCNLIFIYWDEPTNNKPEQPSLSGKDKAEGVSKENKRVKKSPAKSESDTSRDRKRN